MLNIKFEFFLNPPFAENCYLIYNSNKEALIIDPGGNYKKVMKFVKENKLVPLSILLTHGHPDHISNAGFFISEYDIKCYIHEKEMSILSIGKKTWAIIAKSFEYFPPQEKDLVFYPNNSFNIKNFTVEPIFFPGHSLGSCLIKIDNLVLTGDSILKNTIGRTDLIGGNKSQLFKSIKNLRKFDNNIIFLPGHGDIFTNIDLFDINKKFLEIFNS